MLKFGGPERDARQMPVSGNIGLRYVETTRRQHRIRFAIPTIPGLEREQCPAIAARAGRACRHRALLPGDPDSAPPPLPAHTSRHFCYLGPSDLAFATRRRICRIRRENNIHNFLPSFNLRLDITPNWLVRFAASKAISRPDIGLLKNFTA